MAPAFPVFDDHDGERGPRPWEPEPLGLPIEAPRPPPRDHHVGDDPDDDEDDRPVGAIVIDLC